MFSLNKFQEEPAETEAPHDMEVQEPRQVVKVRACEIRLHRLEERLKGEDIILFNVGKLLDPSSAKKLLENLFNLQATSKRTSPIFADNLRPKEKKAKVS
jgi:hypothetical protein